MTTIVFDGNILAVDSRCSTENRQQNACAKCGDKSDRINDDHAKIKTYPPRKVKFNDEFVVATAGCGMTSCISALNQSVRQQLNFEDAGLWAPWLNYGESNGTLVILTEQNLYTLKFEKKVFRIVKQKDVPFCAGSGRRAAMMVLKLMNGTAMDAIAGAAQVDPATGGQIRYIIKPPVGCTEELKIHTADIESLYSGLTKRIKPKPQPKTRR